MRSRNYFPLPFVFILEVLVFFSTIFVVESKNGSVSAGISTFNNTSLPHCYLELLFPDACKDPESLTPEKWTKHLYAMKIDFKSEEADELLRNFNTESTDQKSWNSYETTFCTFKEIPKFPSHCIPNNESVILRDYVNCSDYNSFEIDSIPGFKYGLRITCLAPYPMDIKHQLNPPVPYEGIKVSFSKLEDLQNTNPVYRIQLQIPGRFEPGNLHDFSGNYTIYSMKDSQLQTRLKIYAAQRGNHYLLDNSTQFNIPELELDSGRIQCRTESKLYSVRLRVVQASNPLEVKLLRPCLDDNTPCGSKIAGAKCTSDTSGLCQEVFPNQQQGIVRCSSGEQIVVREFFMGLDLLYYRTYGEILDAPGALISLRLQDGRSYMDHVDEPSENIKLYDGGNFTFRCYFLEYFLVTPIKWAITWENGSKVSFPQISDDTEKIHSETVQLTHPQAESFTATMLKIITPISIHMKSLHCKASLWNSFDYIESSLNFTVLKSEKPTRLPERWQTDMKVTSQEFELSCYWKTVNPKPVYHWKFKNQTLTAVTNPCIKEWTNEDSDTQSSHLSICNSNVKWNGPYVCIAENFLGMASQQILVTIERDDQTISPWIYLGIPCLFLAILVCITVLVYRIYVSQRAILTALEIEAFERGNEKALTGNKMGHEIAEYLPYNKDYDIEWKSFETDNEELGRGAFGIVFLGQIRSRTVAAKTVLPDVEKNIVLSLLTELKIMIYLGKHRHLVELIGACTEFLREGRPYIFVEFCTMGSLQSFLKNGRESFINEIPEEQQMESVTLPASIYVEESCVPELREGKGKSQNGCGKVVFSTSDLIKWSGQIADAMEYLESKKVIHGDLATRNILLSSDLVAKVTDFGLSRQLNNYSMYIKKQQTPLPWRWMAIESLKDMIFTSKSDVWSFGITLWEIFSLAEIPYPGTVWNSDFLESLQFGFRMKRPRFATIGIFERIQSCWKFEPELRPSFAKLKQYFETSGIHGLSCHRVQKIETLSPVDEYQNVSFEETSNI